MSIPEELKAILTTISPEIANMPFDENTVLTDGLGLDKMSLLLFAVSVEDNFDIRFVGTPEIHTLGDVINYIKNYNKGFVMKHENGTYT